MLPQTWRAVLSPQAVEAADTLYQKTQAQRDAGDIIYPPQADIFRAYEAVGPDDIRCVILGQDPYHGAGQAHGLSFSVQEDVKLPPSLRNIYKELESDLGLTPPKNGSLLHWANQGVLLLNAILTVQEATPGSHAKWGWQTLTQDTIRVCNERTKPPVFILWGAPAQKAAERAGVSLTAPNVICSVHPSPLSARGGFFGSKPFSRANALLDTPIQWA